ncbi:MAG: universal stress protein [Thermodesulfobacteriota bacterium]
MKNILWATDGSPEAEKAYRYAKYLAAKSGADIIGVHVVPLSVHLLYENYKDSDSDLEEWKSNIENNAALRFDKARKDLLRQSINFEGLILKGNPSEKIVEIARKRKADLIVMGKHGHGFLESMLAGSETKKVLKGSHIPVLAVKTNKSTAVIKNILVPIDLTECSDSAVLSALELAQITGAKIRVIYVLRIDMYAQDIPASALDIVISDSEKNLSKRVSQIKKSYERRKNSSKNIDIKTEVTHGMGEGASISRYAKKSKTDVIVIHTHNRTGVRRLLLGSVTERVITHSDCSVLALRPK